MSQIPPQPFTTATSGVSVVVPVFKGEATVQELYAQLTNTLAAYNRPWELILVDDASPDNSWSIICDICRHDIEHAVGVQLTKNFGQHAALLAGIRRARFDVLVTMDDDLQHRPDTIPLLLAELDDETDLVYGKSLVEEHVPWRNVSSRLAKWILATTIGAEQARESSALRVFRTSLRDGWVGVSDPYVSIDVLLSWVTNRHKAVPVQMDERQTGTSNYTFGKLARHMVNMLTGYSTRPLRLVTWSGFIASAFGVMTLAYVLIRWLSSDNEVPGFAFVASLISILGGLQLFGLGVIGEYLGRVHVRSMHRPTYVIRRETARDARPR